MKRIIIISLTLSLTLSLITIGFLFWLNMIEITSNNWVILPLFYICLSIGYWFFVGVIGVLIGKFDPTPEENSKVEKTEWDYSTYTLYETKSEEKINEYKGFITSVAIGHITDNPLMGGAVGGDMLGGIIGDSLDGNLFD
jgi:hypothetical protein